MIKSGKAQPFSANTVQDVTVNTPRGWLKTGDKNYPTARILHSLSMAARMHGITRCRA